MVVDDDDDDDDDVLIVIVVCTGRAICTVIARIVSNQRTSAHLLCEWQRGGGGAVYETMVTLYSVARKGTDPVVVTTESLHAQLLPCFTKGNVPHESLKHPSVLLK